MSLTNPPPKPGPGQKPILSEATHLGLKLKELLWRVDQVRTELQNPARTLDDATLADVLDTRDLKALLEGAGHGSA